MTKTMLPNERGFKSAVCLQNNLMELRTAIGDADVDRRSTVISNDRENIVSQTYNSAT